MDLTPFTSPYTPNTNEDRQAMLQAIGVSSPEELFQDIPEQFRNPYLNLPIPMSELDLRRELEACAGRNLITGQYSSFLGAGAYRHFIPSVVQALVSRGEFSTSYTPYQAEASQGTLQTAYEFQTLVCQLLEMETANTGMYDGATSLAEAALMACRITQRYKIAVLETVFPAYQDVLRTYTAPQGIQVVNVPRDAASISNDISCLIVQHPNFFGYLEDIAHLSQTTHNAGALLVTSVDPIAMGMFQPPGYYKADIATAEGQPMGIPPSFGGPYVGLFTCQQQYLRQMPGRIVGRTIDDQRRTGYVLTMQTREQHIRRERATSNICTSQSLAGLMSTIYLACLGKEGFRQVAELCYHKAHYAASQIAKLPGYTIPLTGTFFKEFVVQCPTHPSHVNQYLLERGIIGGLDINDRLEHGLLLCVTEMNSRTEIDQLVEALSELNR